MAEVACWARSSEGMTAVMGEGGCLMEVEVRGARGVWLLCCTALTVLEFELRDGVDIERQLPVTTFGRNNLPFGSLDRSVFPSW